MSGSSRSGEVFNKTYKDFETAPTEGDLFFPTLYSEHVRVGEEEVALIVGINKLDDANVQIMPQGSVDGVNWSDLLNVDARFDYPALIPITNKPNAALSVSDPWPFIRVRVQTANDDYTDQWVPTGGSVLVQWAAKRSRQNVV